MSGRWTFVALRDAAGAFEQSGLRGCRMAAPDRARGEVLVRVRTRSLARYEIAGCARVRGRVAAHIATSRAGGHLLGLAARHPRKPFAARGDRARGSQDPAEPLGRIEGRAVHGAIAWGKADARNSRGRKRLAPRRGRIRYQAIADEIAFPREPCPWSRCVERSRHRPVSIGLLARARGWLGSRDQPPARSRTARVRAGPRGRFSLVLASGGSRRCHRSTTVVIRFAPAVEDAFRSRSSTSSWNVGYSAAGGSGRGRRGVNDLAAGDRGCAAPARRTRGLRAVPRNLVCRIPAGIDFAPRRRPPSAPSRCRACDARAATGRDGCVLGLRSSARSPSVWARTG